MDEALILLLIGFLAQLVDGALGMAYGLTATSLLLWSGFTPAAASATVHAAESITVTASATSHYFAGHVDWSLVRRLAIPGCLGGALGASLLALDITVWLRMVVYTYLIIMGCRLAWRSLYPRAKQKTTRRIGTLGFGGGFFDAAGGGGWGPIVSSTLLFDQGELRKMIGSSIAAECFVTVAITIAFAAHLDLASLGKAALALIAGGVLGAPLGPIVLRVIPATVLTIGVGLLIVSLGLFGLFSIARG